MPASRQMEGGALPANLGSPLAFAQSKGARQMGQTGEFYLCSPVESTFLMELKDAEWRISVCWKEILLLSC